MPSGLRSSPGDVAGKDQRSPTWAGCRYSVRKILHWDKQQDRPPIRVVSMVMLARSGSGARRPLKRPWEGGKEVGMEELRKHVYDVLQFRDLLAEQLAELSFVVEFHTS
jgi:hypothetical protein